MTYNWIIWFSFEVYGEYMAPCSSNSQCTTTKALVCYTATGAGTGYCMCANGYAYNGVQCGMHIYFFNLI